MYDRRKLNWRVDHEPKPTMTTKLVNGQSKVVPSVSFAVLDATGAQVATVQAEAVPQVEKLIEFWNDDEVGEQVPEHLRGEIW